ncbi:MAG: hypothetical protein K5662_07380 [Lachnospiraceae bacterium]|nr:hypothetical protein [Lachnospiraceae bacterium]
MFSEGFPIELNEEYYHVISVVSKKTVNNVSCGVSDGYNSENEIYYLSDGSKVRFPYRLYFEDDEYAYDGLNDIEKSIYDCIFTRHCDGHIREKHLRRLLSTEMQEWFIPYLLRLSSEYVVEIVELIYETLKDSDNQMIQDFCHNNPLLLKRAYTRMVSYWECFYKSEYPIFKSYVGCKLFKECISPHTNFEKI